MPLSVPLVVEMLHCQKSRGRIELSGHVNVLLVLDVFVVHRDLSMITKILREKQNIENVSR